MNNLSQAVANLTDKKADDIYTQLKKTLLLKDNEEYGFYYVNSQIATLIGGYSGGSDVYDSGDELLMANLLNINEDAYDFSMSYSDISDIKDNYAETVVNDLKSAAGIEELSSVKDLYKDAITNKVFDGSIQDLVAVLKKSNEFKSDIYAYMTKPRG